MNCRGNRREPRNRDRDHGTQKRADDPAEHRQHDRFGEHLHHDVAAPGAQRLPQSDFARALRHHHQHDIHDDDASHHERQGDHADEHRKNAARRRTVDPEHRLRRENREVVGLARLHPPRNSQRNRRIVDGRRNLRQVARLHRHRELPARAEHLLELPERNDGELILRLAQQRSTLRADADHAEVHALNLNRFLERFDVGAEQPFGRLRANHRNRPGEIHFGGAHEAAALGIVVGEVDVLRRDARHLNAVDGRVAVGNAAARVRQEHHRRDERAVAPDGRGIEPRDAGIGLNPLEVFVAADDAVPLDDKRVGAGLVENSLFDRRVQSLNQRHHRDDRRHGHDVAEHGHQRPELRAPDRAQRDAGRVKVLVHDVLGGAFGDFPPVSTLTGSPSLMPRTEL